MNNFKSSVPVAIQTKLKALADMAENEWHNTIVLGNRRYGSEGEVRINEIEGNYVSGWMPKQDGGYSVENYYRSDVDSSYHFTEKQTDFVNEQSKQCFDSFLSDNEIDSETEWDSLTDEQKEEFSQYENEWFNDGALLQLQMFAEGFDNSMWSKEKQITIRLSINYKDAPYFREKYAEDIKQVILSVDEFMAQDNKSIIQQFTV
jgi:hypothetical protein